MLFSILDVDLFGDFTMRHEIISHETKHSTDEMMVLGVSENGVRPRIAILMGMIMTKQSMEWGSLVP